MPENFPIGQFLRKADKCFGVCIVNLSMVLLTFYVGLISWRWLTWWGYCLVSFSARFLFLSFRKILTMETNFVLPVLSIAHPGGLIFASELVSPLAIFSKTQKLDTKIYSNARFLRTPVIFGSPVSLSTGSFCSLVNLYQILAFRESAHMARILSFLRKGSS